MGHRSGRRMVYLCPECKRQWFRVEERIGGALLIYCGYDDCGYYVGHIDIRAGLYVVPEDAKVERREQRQGKGFPF